MCCLQAALPATALPGGAARCSPPSALPHAGAELDITLIGAEDHMEIWDTLKWEEHRQSVLLDFSELAEDLEEI